MKMRYLITDYHSLKELCIHGHVFTVLTVKVHAKFFKKIKKLPWVNKQKIHHLYGK